MKTVVQNMSVQCEVLLLKINIWTIFWKATWTPFSGLKTGPDFEYKNGTQNLMKFWNLVFGIKLISKTRSREPVAAGPTIASSVVRELRFAAT